MLYEFCPLFGERFSGTHTSQPQVRLLLAGNAEKQIKPVSGIVRWLRGDEGVTLTENYDDNNSRPQYLDFVAEAGESLPSKVSRLIEATFG